MSFLNLFKFDKKKLRLIYYSEFNKPILIDISDSPIVKATIGGSFFAVLDERGNIYFWGDNSSGQLACGSQKHILGKCNKLSFPSKIVDISAGWQHILFLDENGRAYSCGSNIHNQLGIFNNTSLKDYFIADPIEVNIPEKIKLISAGRNYSIFVTDKMKIYTCGKNIHGECNLSSETLHVEMSSFSIENIEIIKIASGDHHTIMLDKDGKIYGMGSNIHFQIIRDKEGFFSDKIPFMEINLPFNEKISDIKVGPESTAVKTISGKWYRWGGFIIYKGEKIPRFDCKEIFVEENKTVPIDFEMGFGHEFCSFIN